jgi:mannose-6-phosphate isomerase-like protein (cupin superfamily)
MKALTRILSAVLFSAVLFALGACRSPAPTDAPLVTPLEPQAFAADEAVASRTLFTSPRVSAHATTVRGPLPAHYHAHHEETVVVLSGTARMRLGGTWHELRAGDLIHVPKGVVHEVDVDEPVTVLSLFAPPFHGEDRVFVDGESSGGEESPRAAESGSPASASAAASAGFRYLPDFPTRIGRGRLRDS